MSFLANQFIDQRVTLITDSWTIITFDVVPNEQHENKSIITDNPVEDGSLMSDHVSNLPVVLNLTAVFSDTPISKNIPFSTFTQVSEGRARGLYNELCEIRESRKKFKIVTGLKAYANLVFEELTAPRQSGDGAKIMVQMKIRQIKVADSMGLGSLMPTTADVEHTVAGLVSLGIMSL